jgi:hypothetical protein
MLPLYCDYQHLRDSVINQTQQIVVGIYTRKKIPKLDAADAQIGEAGP